MRARGRDVGSTPALKAASELRSSSSGSLFCRLWPCLIFCLMAHTCMVVIYPSFTSNVLPEPLRHMPDHGGNPEESLALSSILDTGSSIPYQPQVAAATRRKTSTPAVHQDSSSSNSRRSSSSTSSQSAPWASSTGWLSDVYAAVPSKDVLLVHQPFFWTELAATAHVRIGNFQRDSKHGRKGFAKVIELHSFV